ncbi:hypothetical protein H4R33_001508 [Dimargaris cristalligena]|uniref:Uncharacterized protein n=1 Tax=Dimargaris cristalligena TaxID=215637 RepID=A0A4Q0A1E5_9FUNG|nr:hypothetical protein H4R33_001508 [Dimargaris cristalligena]RKP39903.1 hypothetical protein BJ085DRAFT_32603 [Dimargaris cristalligena]|eukprot:RKP39903.1 hypothetical protein BJ085DRAFT_32603 [Dimargaris cristalligena]
MDPSNSGEQGPAGNDQFLPLAFLEHIYQSGYSDEALEDFIHTLQNNRTLETARVSRQVRRRAQDTQDRAPTTAAPPRRSTGSSSPETPPASDSGATRPRQTSGFLPIDRLDEPLSRRTRVGADRVPRRPADPGPGPIISDHVRFHGQFLPDHPKFSRLQRLVFNIDSCDGGAVPEYPVEAILHPDSRVYSSEKPRNINICLRFNKDLSKANSSVFTVGSIAAYAPMSFYDAPCADLMFFIASTRVSFRELGRYDNFTYGNYMHLMDRMKRNAWTPNERELQPIAFCRLGIDNNFTVEQDVAPVSGSFIYVKLLRSHASSKKIDLQYVEVRGFTGSCISYSSEIN